MHDICPSDRSSDPASLFETWMGMTDEEWEALGEADETADEQTLETIGPPH